MKHIRCNKCGRVLLIQTGNQQEDCLKVQKEWGYFSKKDLELHEFHMCEDCYDAMIGEFIIPIQKQAVEEVL